MKIIPYNINKLVGIIVQECINSFYVVEEQCGYTNKNSETVRKTMATAATCATVIEAKFL